MDFDYDENDEQEDYISYDKWLIKIDNDLIKNFDSKEEAIENILDEITMISNLTNNVSLIKHYKDYDDLLNNLSNMCADDFYDYIEYISEDLNFDNEIKLINIDNEEPDFGEL